MEAKVKKNAEKGGVDYYLAIEDYDMRKISIFVQKPLLVF
jgi:hypothetical protein